MSRRQKFEQAYAEAHGIPVETFETYRMGDTYRLPGIAKCWRFWNMALDLVEPSAFDSHAEYLAAVMPIKKSTAKHIAEYLEDNQEVLSGVIDELQKLGRRVAP